MMVATIIGDLWPLLFIMTYKFRLSITPWVAIQASRCAGRVDRILAVKNPGVPLRPSYENGGRVMSPGTIAILLQDIPGEKGSLLIRCPDLVRTLYWASLVGIYEPCPAQVSTNEISRRSYKPGAYRCAIQCISPLYVCFECIMTIVYEEMLTLLPTFGYRWHRLTEILWTGFSMCSRSPATADSLQCMFVPGHKKLIKWPNVHTISYRGPF